MKKPLAKNNLNEFTKWAQDCDTNHASCVAASNDYIPTRLLMVKDNKLRLIAGGTRYHR